MPRTYPDWERTKKTFQRLFVWGLSIVGLLLLLQIWLTPEKDRLAQQYQIPEDKVIVDSKPHGCDFDDAPLGNKHCHYEKQVDVMRECPGSNCKVSGVYVSWRKVEE
jgi:hypothetical protein